MCGIVGARHDWLLSQGLEPARAMAEAVASLAWRGPDGQAVERAGAWWLGCARLAIGPKNSRQPVVRRGGRFAGVLNGAITNARELWARLLPGVERRRVLPNDAWLPLLAVERGDLWALGRLRGHHAYAVVDAQTGALTIARDHYGEKPLLGVIERVGGAPTLVAFASTTGALQRLGAGAAYRGRRLSEWFRFGWADTSAHRWSSRRRVVAIATGPGSSAKPPGTLRDAVIASVARCVDTTAPVALSLSGGLDSSCLALALHANGRRVPAYQVRSAGAPGDERSAAAAVAARAALELRPVDVGIEALDALPFLTACAGLPLGDPSVLAMHALARAAAADGTRVLLSGEGGDELFLGYRRYSALTWLVRMPWLRPFAPRWSMHYAGRLLRAVTAPDPITALLAVTPPAFGDAVLAPELTRRRCWHDDVRSPRPAMRRGFRVRVARDHDLQGYLKWDLLPKVDVACMAAGIEARAPFLEGDAAALARDHVRLGKRQLRQAFANELPADVLRLPKTGFALPLDRWFRGDLPWLDLLAEPRTQQRSHLRPGGVVKVVDLHRRRRTNIGHGLYLLVACELFLRLLEKENPARAPTASEQPT